MNFLNQDLFMKYPELEFDTLEKLNEQLKMFTYNILHINIRRLNSNFAMLESYINCLSVKPHVIICSETWVLENCNLYNIDGYSIYYNEGSIDSADGVVIYVLNDIVHKIEIIKFKTASFLNCEIKLNMNCTILITALYRCHDFDKKDFIIAMKKIIGNNKHKHHFVVGDFNVNILEIDIDSEELLNNFLSFGYCPMFNTITRPNDSGGTCIDNFYNKSEINLTALKHTQILPDHYPIFCAFNCENEASYKINYIMKVNYNKLFIETSCIHWAKYESIKDPNIGINLLIADIKTCIVSATNKIKKSKLIIRKPWITPALLKSIKHKEHLYNLYKINKNCHNLKKEYMDYNKLLQKLIREAKNRHEIHIAEKSSKDPRKLWSYVNEKLGKKKQKKLKLNK